MGGFRVSWRPVYWTSERGESLEQNADPCAETVTAKQLVTKLDLDNGGVIGAAAARRLRLDGSQRRLSEEGAAARGLQEVSPTEDAALRLGEFVNLVREAPVVSGPVFSFGSDAVLQKWVAIGICDFLEVFDGLAALES